MNEITTVGLDLAKNVFQVHGVDAEGSTILRKPLRRAQVLAFFSRLPRCLVGMEACATAHYWARELRALGHEVRLMPAQYVKAYVKRNKNDAADAEAICEAVVRPTMRFVPAKTAEQQAAVARFGGTLIRPLCGTPNYLLPGGGHPHMKRRSSSRCWGCVGGGAAGRGHHCIRSRSMKSRIIATLAVYPVPSRTVELASVLRTFPAT